MTQAPLPDALKRFLIEDIVLVERLDLLLFLYRHADAWFPASRLAEQLDMPADAVLSHLEHLAARSLLDVKLAESVIFCYQPAREELSRLVEAVAQAHFHRRDAVVAVLAGRPADGARRFAEAFLFRRGRKRDG